MNAGEWLTLVGIVAAHASAVIFGVSRVLLRHEIRIVRIEDHLWPRDGQRGREGVLKHEHT